VHLIRFPRACVVVGFSTGLMAVAATSPLAAQVSSSDINNAAAYGALLLTPPGAVAPIATSTILDQRQQGVVFAIRYGYVPTNGAVGFNNLGATAVLPVTPEATVSLTGGTTIPTCSSNTVGCSPGLMLGVGGDMRLAALGTAPATRITVSVNGELGYGKPRNVDHEFSGMVGLPIALLFNGDPTQGLRIVPWITPAFGFGNEQISSGAPSASGQRAMIGGGIALTNGLSNIGASLGVQRIIITNGKTMVGLSITLGGR